MSNTKLGKTTKNYGKQYSIVSTHLSGPEILSSQNYLVPNSLIVSSPNLDNGEDNTGYQLSHSLFFTDYEGTAARLTYTILPGNGLVVNAYHWPWNVTDKPYTVDTLTFEIDHDSLKTTSDKGQLYVSKPDIIDNYTLMVHQEFGSPHSYIGVVTANLEKATDVKYGIVRGDNYTISANNGILNVNTANLQYADDTLNHNGIIRCNPDTPENAYIRTIEATDGVLKVITANLDRATAETVGVVKPDLVTTSTNANGTISVLTSGLDYASQTSYGTVRPDNYTIQIKENYPGVIFAEAENLRPTRIENGVSHFGVIKLDQQSLGIDTANCTYVQRYSEIVALLNRYLDDYDHILKWLIDHENRITALENQAAAEYIYSFNNYGRNITELDLPVWDQITEVVKSEEKFYSVQFSVNTNCKFHISVRYENNVSKPITLHSVRLGDNPVVNASGLSQYIFESTNRNESTLNFTFLCDNYTASSPDANTPTFVILRVSSINDASIYKEGQHIFKRWNTNAFIQPPKPEPITTSTETISYEYQYGRKSLQFIKSSSDTITQINNTNNIVQYVNDVNQGSRSNISFYYIGMQPVTCITKKTTDRYIDGEYVDSDTQQLYDLTYSYMSYFSVPLEDESGRVFTNDYLTRDNITYYIRDIDINDNSFDNNNYWTQMPNEEVSWISIYNSALASNTEHLTDSENAPVFVTAEQTASTAGGGTNGNYTSSGRERITGGYNVLNLITTSNASTHDRRARITLKVKNANLQDWEPNKSTLVINYIDDVRINTCNVNINAMCRNNYETPLKIHISKTIGSNPTGNEWKVYIQYCLKTINGEAVKVEYNNETYEGIRIAQNKFDELATTGRQSTVQENTQDKIQAVTDDTVFNKLIVTINKNYSDLTINVSNNNIYATDSSGNTITSGVSFNTTNILPNSIFDILQSGRSQNTTNIYSAFEITNAVVDFVNDERSDNVVVNWSSNGTWPTNYAQEEQITFGNASITSIEVKPWDDTRMQIEFTIRPGSNTVLPVGSEISVQTSIAPNCVLFNGSNSYPYNDYYDNIIFSWDAWTATGMKLKMSLNNTIPVAPDPNSQLYITHLVSSESTQQEPIIRDINNQNDYTNYVTSTPKVVYDGDKGAQSTTMISTTSTLFTEEQTTTRGTDGLTMNDHVSLNISAPMIQSITGIRFNFRLKATYGTSRIASIMDFAVTLNGLSNKVMINANYNNGGITAINPPMINAFYNTNANVTTIVENESVEVAATSSVEQLAEEIEGLKDIISSLTSEVTTSGTNQQAEYQPGGGLKPTGVSDLVGGRAGTDVQAMY